MRAGTDSYRLDLTVREAAMAWVGSHARRSGGVVTRSELESFSFDGEQIKLIDHSRGIRNPRQLAATISILSSPNGPYDDVDTADGMLRYAYRAGDPNGSDNRKLRAALQLELPLILLRGISAGVFVPIFPVYVVADVPEAQCFEIAVDESLRLISNTAAGDDQRRYAERLTKLRLHQPVFRARVIRAYDTTCAVCRLKRATLLDAAHILGDAEGGRPDVPNGLALCKIHHAAYDQNIIGVRPGRDLIVEVHPEVRTESDGPMLLHGLQEMHGVRLHVPSQPGLRPDQTAIERRYELFHAS